MIRAVDAAVLHLTPIDLRSLLTGTVEALREQARALDVDLSIDAEAGLAPLDLDGERIAWAVVTLVRNALRYADRLAGGLPCGSLHVHLRAEDAWVVLTVEDDGLGVPSERAAKMLPGSRGVMYGSGVGLTLIQDVVRGHGGTVDVEDKVDAFRYGTTVTLRLPTAAAAHGVPGAKGLGIVESIESASK
jgi:two-component system sporulation sensor kinase A